MESFQLLLLKTQVSLFVYRVCVYVYMCMEMLMCMGTCGGQRTSTNTLFPPNKVFH